MGITLLEESSNRVRNIPLLQVFHHVRFSVNIVTVTFIIFVRPAPKKERKDAQVQSETGTKTGEMRRPSKQLEDQTGLASNPTPSALLGTKQRREDLHHLLLFHIVDPLRMLRQEEADEKIEIPRKPGAAAAGRDEIAQDTPLVCFILNVRTYLLEGFKAVVVTLPGAVVRTRVAC